MFIAHAPAGYLSARLLLAPLQVPDCCRRGFLWSGVSGAVAPDFDLFYFHLVDHRAHTHHTYVTHYPALWLTLLAAALLWRRSAPSPGAAMAVVFSLNGLLHMVLDSVVGGIRWLAPVSDHFFAVARVPARFHPWWLNFVLHWSFVLEVAILGWALHLAAKSWRPKC